MNRYILTLLVVFLMVTAGFSGTEATYNWQNSGNLVFFKSGSYESTIIAAPVVYYDDFLGADLVIPAEASDESGCDWVKVITGSGPPTLAYGADASNGTVICALEATGETQEAFLSMDDQRTFTIGQGCIFEARVQLTVLPSTSTTEVYIGVGSNSASNTGECVYRACFMAAGSGLLYAETDDNATEYSATTGTTATTSSWHTLRIDMQSVAGIRFYIDGVQVADSTTFAYAATGANLTLQPFCGVYKEDGTGLATLTIDYIRIWQNRTAQ